MSNICIPAILVLKLKYGHNIISTPAPAPGLRDSKLLELKQP